MNPILVVTNRRLALAALLAAFALAVPAAAQTGFFCPAEKPRLVGPDTVRQGDSYSLSWSHVLAEHTSAVNYYYVERSADATFATLIDRVKTSRSSQAYDSAPKVATLFHRVVVVTTCPTASPALFTSNVWPVTVKQDCTAPAAVPPLEVKPANPPAFSTYVVTWAAQSTGSPGITSGGVLYRIRRTAGAEVKESLSDATSAAFADSPGEYTYQVRPEARCGVVGAWSAPVTVSVGGNSALVLVSDPKPVVAIAPAEPTTTFAVRNAGTTQLSISVSAPDALRVVPSSFALDPGATRSLAVALKLEDGLPATPYHATLILADGATYLKVPIHLAAAAAGASARVHWSDNDADVGLDPQPIRRSIVNEGGSPAAFVGAASSEWLSVESLDGQPWDRPLGPRESRPVLVRVDRSLRRAASGTETAAITITTAGYPSAPDALVVTDDGPVLAAPPGGGPSSGPAVEEAKTRILYASLPNVLDLHGVGRFTADLWLTNMDVLSSIEVRLLFKPLGYADTYSGARSVDLTLAPGETRRYRNPLASLAGYEGACAVEVRSAATTLSATALVSNTPLTASGAKRRSALDAVGDPAAGSTATGQYGFEMRPTIPGEGVKEGDPSFVLSGLAHDARRRSNVILTETAGVATKVLLSLFDNSGAAVLKDGVPVQRQVDVPALGTVQINDADLFDADPLPGAPYAIVSYQPATGTDASVSTGAVVPFATVIDSGTEDASLRVGVSARELDPLGTSASATAAPRVAAREALLPFNGGAAPLLFPAAHLPGAPLSDGAVPTWKTRVTFTNVNEREQRQLLVRFFDQAGNVAPAATFIGLSPRGSVTLDDVLASFLSATGAGDVPAYGALRVENTQRTDGTWENTWADVDVQTETYTSDPRQPALGEFKTGMEAFTYRHGYSSFRSNLGTAQIEGAESSSRFRTNLILQEVGGAPCTVAVAAYAAGSFVPLATATVPLPAFGYVSKELFKTVLGLELSELADVRVVVRQVDGDGVFLAFASKISLVTGDPANIFLRPASAGTGR